MTRPMTTAPTHDVRPATAADLPAIATLARRVLPDTYEPLVGSSYVSSLMADWWGPTLAAAVADDLVHVAIADGGVVGMVELGTFAGEPAVWKLYVERAYRHRGIGHALLAAVRATLHPAVDRLLIEHIAANVDAARFYEREGFVEVRREPADDDRLTTVWRARPISAHDEYGAMAEFHEVLMDPAWARLRPHLATAFGTLGPADVVADLGAGSGVGTLALARATRAEIVVVEPNRTMRSMLLARVAAADELGRVTVHADALPAGLTALPHRLDGVVATHMLGHLPPAAWRHVLTWIGDHLAPGASAVLTVSRDRSEDEDDGGDTVEEAVVGRHRYRATHRKSDRPDSYDTLFEVLTEDGAVVQSLVATGHWQTVTTADVRAALATGIAVDELEPGIIVIRPFR